MTMHKCPDCHTRQTSLAWAKRDVRDVARKLARARKPRDIARLKDQLAKAKQDVSDAAANLEAHEMACEFVPEAPMPIRGTGAERGRRQRKPKPGAKVKARRAARVPTRDVLLAAIDAQPVVTLPKDRRTADVDRQRAKREKTRTVAVDVGGNDTRFLPITGRCHGEGCGKPIPPGRRLCGRCLTKRGTL